MRHYPPKPTAKPTHNGWSPYRDRAKQAAFREALIRRSGGRCEWQPTCNTPYLRLQAHHIEPISQGGSYDLENGLLLCSRHHRKTTATGRLWART